MTKSFTSMLAAVVLATGALPLAQPAEAQSRAEFRAERDHYVRGFCSRYPRDADCRDWRYNRSRWDDRRYRDWYRDRHDDDDNNAGLAAIFGLATGALLGGLSTGSILGGPGAILGAPTRGGIDVTAHVRACQARYRSYDPATNTFLGYDGFRHPCRL